MTNPTPPKPPPTPTTSSETTTTSSETTTAAHHRSLRTKPSCCACKHQRRRCSPDCPLAPYFPPDKSTEFRNVHRLFGIHNVVNLLKNIPPNYREDAIKSIIFEAYMRATNPTGGSLSVILELQRKIFQTESELEAVNRHLAVFRSRLCDQDQVRDQDWERLVFKDAGEGISGSGGGRQVWSD